MNLVGIAAKALLLAAVSLAVATPALAGGPDELEPGLGLRVAFGGQGLGPARLSLKLDYEAGRDLGEDLRLPSALEWTLDSSGRHALYANGLQLGFGPAWRTNEGEEGAESSWGWNIGTILLAGGAAIALIVAVGGETAEDMQEEHNENGPGSFGNNGASDDNVCEVPMPDGTTGNGCAVGL